MGARRRGPSAVDKQLADRVDRHAPAQRLGLVDVDAQRVPRGVPHIAVAVLELSLDERHMKVPAALKSARPFAKTSVPSLEGRHGERSVVWACPKWRLVVIPSTAAPLALSLNPWSKNQVPPQTKSTFRDKDSSAIMKKPSWLKANDAALSERKQTETENRVKYKQFVKQLKKGHKGNHPGSPTSPVSPTAASSNEPKTNPHLARASSGRLFSSGSEKWPVGRRQVRKEN